MILSDERKKHASAIVIMYHCILHVWDIRTWLRCYVFARICNLIQVLSKVVHEVPPLEIFEMAKLIVCLVNELYRLVSTRDRVNALNDNSPISYHGGLDMDGTNTGAAYFVSIRERIYKPFQTVRYYMLQFDILYIYVLNNNRF